MILLHDFIGTVSLIELLWTATAIGALIIGWRNYSEAREDLEALGETRNGAWRIARGNIRRERVRAIVNGSYLAFGILAGTIPANPNPTAATVVISIGLTATCALLALNSYYDRRDRLYLLQHYHDPGVPETLIQKEDREVGDVRREKQIENKTAPPL